MPNLICDMRCPACDEPISGREEVATRSTPPKPLTNARTARRASSWSR